MPLCNGGLHTRLDRESKVQHCVAAAKLFSIGMSIHVVAITCCFVHSHCSEHSFALPDAGDGDIHQVVAAQCMKHLWSHLLDKTDSAYLI